MPCRFIAALVLVAAAAISLGAQATPSGWKLRVDESRSATDPDGSGNIRFTAVGAGLRAVTPQAAVFWQPTSSASGVYTLKGSFLLNEPSNHTNYYGLVLGGRALDGAAQAYLYFVVAQDGSWLLKRRQGERATDLVPEGRHAAIRRPDAQGRSVNDLEVRVGATRVDFVVNGTTVHSMDKAGLETDGLYGFRVNHFLDVTVSGLSVAR